MEKYKDQKEVDGLLFKYLHFYGSYDYIGASPRWYSHEIRVVRNDKSITSFRDAQGFRIRDNEKLKVKAIDAYMYHYGWVKEPESMQKKQQDFNKLWHDDEWVDKNVAKATEFDYSMVDLLSQFKGDHPAVMKDRIQQKNWKFDHNLSINRMSFKNKLKNFLKKYFGIHLGYKNYIKI